MDAASVSTGGFGAYGPTAQSGGFVDHGLPLQGSFDSLALLDILECFCIVLALIDADEFLERENALSMLFDKVWDQLWCLSVLCHR